MSSRHFRSMNMTSLCNMDCNCENVKYNPVCHKSTMTTFFSACHAGCTRILSDTEFGDCKCVNEILYRLKNFEDNVDSVKSGLCESDCKEAYMFFMIITCILQVLGSSARIGNVLVNYRCVAVADKSFAQGVAIMFLSLFALIPGPIIYGFIIDSTCIIWDHSCGTTGNCWFHDKELFIYNVNVSSAGEIFYLIN